MPKIELTIQTDYLPDWGAYEGIRELLQNGKDAETEHGARFVVDHVPTSHLSKVGTLRITTEGTTLAHENLLLGNSSKADRADLIGKFGEGLKLGVLALVRAGHPVKIRSGGETWIPEISRSARFNADVLQFDIRKGNKFSDRVRIEIGGIPESEWLEMREHFLFLIPEDEQDRVETHFSGALLKGPRFVGRIYVKGIFVQTKGDLKYGYDFRDADVDRDRRMISSWDLNYRMSQIQQAAAATQGSHAFFKLLASDAADVEGFSQYSGISESLSQEVAECFQKEHGADAIPVENLEQSKEIAHLGKEGIVVPRPLREVLRKAMGDLDSVKQSLKEETIRSYSWGELDPSEQGNLESAISVLQFARPEVSLNTIDIVDFRSDSLQGMHKDGRELLSRKVLSDRAVTLKVMVHEFCHDSGSDGEKSHVAEIEKTWSTIVEALRTIIE